MKLAWDFLLRTFPTALLSRKAQECIILTSYLGPYVHYLWAKE